MKSNMEINSYSELDIQQERVQGNIVSFAYILGQAIGPLWDFYAPISIIVEL